ncbi:MAG: tetraacyldisaccharide 4'-kinase [Deltaproteobacteria bacterium]|nr:tetraacyldisaccharide 4'-kinase [Deltaproteobacteria bacterium]
MAGIAFPAKQGSHGGATLRSFDERLKEIWEGERTGSASGAIATVLRLLSIPYGAAVALRNHLYDRELLRPMKLPCLVVSVGNLTVGGTGKTPTVILLAALLKEHGYRPAVLSRGYGGHAKASVNVVSDGKRVILGWREAGDEPVLIAGALPGIPVLTGPKRSLTGKAAVERFGADILVLDDAFQHRSLFRDIDIVLVDAARPFANGFLLPRGPLREPPQALRRAGILLQTGDADHEEPLREVASLQSFRGIRRPRELVEAATGRVSSPAALRGQKVFAFAGIGSPEAFRRGLTALGAKVVSLQAFPDHHPYGRSDIEALRRLAAESGAARIVTTEKDGVRLADFPDFQAEISLLRIGMEITPAGPFAELIFSRLAHYKS